MSAHGALRRGTGLATLLGLCLAACGRSVPQAAPAAPAIAPAREHFVDRRFGIAVDYPSTLQAGPHAPASYLGRDSWRGLAGAGGHVTPLLALTLPGSNHMATATLRIGASRSRHALDHCLQPPAGARTPGTATQLGGVAFTSFELSDAAMSHFLHMQVYRAVHDGTCYAVDLGVSGTRPEVYDPPRQPPFSPQTAMQKLHMLLGDIRFLR